MPCEWLTNQLKKYILILFTQEIFLYFVQNDYFLKNNSVKKFHSSI